MPHDWDADFDRILRTALTGLPADQPLRPDADLATLGMDSLKSIQVLFALEDRYRVSFPDDMLGHDLLATPQSLWNGIGTARRC
ncbi:phosphopantetheine-binding protein [Actinokineospora enzanensis]|uniref:phosphopantetheine-binding protein n=1 Tax=Actinokineospora enzanensis TaxID=155975 RepID=UPI0003802B93|nr:phosphopantetheine-binding protein [Actinokineospora enzanensis]